MPRLRARTIRRSLPRFSQAQRQRPGHQGDSALAKKSAVAGGAAAPAHVGRTGGLGDRPRERRPGGRSAPAAGGSRQTATPGRRRCRSRSGPRRAWSASHGAIVSLNQGRLARPVRSQHGDDGAAARGRPGARNWPAQRGAGLDRVGDPVELAPPGARGPSRTAGRKNMVLKGSVMREPKGPVAALQPAPRRGRVRTCGCEKGL